MGRREQVLRRLRTGIPFVVIVHVLLVVSTSTLVLLGALGAFVCAREFLGTVRAAVKNVKTSAVDTVFDTVLCGMCSAIAVLSFHGGHTWLQWSLATCLIAAIVSLTWRHALRAEDSFKTNGAEILLVTLSQLFVLIYVGASIGSIATAYTLMQTSENQKGLSLVYLCIVSTTVFGDNGGLVGGMLFGRNGRKPVPALSPNKTLAGFIGHVVAAVLGALAYQLLVTSPAWALEISLSRTLLFGLLCGILGLTGDLFESLVKRSAAKKDAAAWLPGWGGLLDRVDGLLLAFPAVSLLAHGGFFD
ncbi:MAG: hypothetical protein MHM6MM_004521 [Cercozoa sp. M6MM]